MVRKPPSLLIAGAIALGLGQTSCTPRMFAAAAVGTLVGAAIVSQAEHDSDCSCRRCQRHRRRARPQRQDHYHQHHHYHEHHDHGVD
jgi:hypothetical protein